MKNQYPMKPMAEALARQGRGPDSIMMHMAPAEVAGIAALTGRQPTINPMTGQPEGFVFLAPLLGMLGGSMGLGALGTGVLTGVGTAAVTGDLKRGLVAGLTGGLASGLGEAVGEAIGGADSIGELFTDAIGSGGEEVVAEVGSEVATQAATDTAAQTAGDGLSEIAVDASRLSADGTPFTVQETGIGAFDNLNQAATDKVGEMSLTQQGLGTAIGAGQLAQYDYEDMLAKQGRQFEEDKAAKLQRAYDDLAGAQLAAQPGLSMGPSPYRSIMSRNTPPPRGYADGGFISPIDFSNFDFSMYNPMGSLSTDNVGASVPAAPSMAPAPPAYEGREAEVIAKASAGRPLSREDQAVLEGYYNRYSANRPSISTPVRTTSTAPTLEDITSGDYDFDFQNIMSSGTPPFSGMKGGTVSAPALSSLRGIDPVSVQTGLRGQNVVSPPRDYMAGFEPEFNYYQNNPDSVDVPSRAYRPVMQGIESTGDYFEDVSKRSEKKADGGMVGIRTPMGDDQIMAGGIANVPTEMRSDMPTKKEILAVASAIAGQIDNADLLIESFVQKYGTDTFRMIRDLVLKAGNPQAQTEGLIRGQGSGMDDMVTGTIGTEESVAVSPGEFIVPADVVSGLGDGSSEAGSEELYGMMDRVRMMRGGTTRQAPSISGSMRKILPA